MISSTQLLGFLMHPKGGRKGQRRGIHSFVHLKSLRESKRMRFQALGEESLGASLHGDSSWRLSAQFI
jgi:hypothetical protein